MSDETTFVLEEAPEGFETIPAGTKLESIVETVKVEDSFFWNDKDDHSKGKQKKVSFKFKVADDENPEYNGRVLFGDTNTKFNNHPNCHLYTWVCEIYGVDELPTGFKLDLEDLVGLNVVVEIDTYPKKGEDRENTATWTGNKAVSVQRVGGYAAALND